MKNYKEFNHKDFNAWIECEGDKTHRLNYNLNPNSIVFDVGGFKGEWAENIYNKYNCNIHIFEPINKYVEIIDKKFKSNNKVILHKCGLSNKNEEVKIYHLNDSSSIFGEGNSYENIQLKSIFDFINYNNIDKVNLIKINIEGSEYDLLEDIIEKKIQSNFENFQIQYHRFIPNCEERRNKIREQLSKTHKITYDYEFIWENWEIKK